MKGGGEGGRDEVDVAVKVSTVTVADGARARGGGRGGGWGKEVVRSGSDGLVAAAAAVMAGVFVVFSIQK